MDSGSGSDYVKLADNSTPPGVTRNHYFPQNAPDAFSDDSDGDERNAAQPPSLWRRYKLWANGARSAPSFQSGYLTLIPLSDSRLKPQRTALLLALALLMTLGSMSAMFFLVSRGVSVGTVTVKGKKMSITALGSNVVLLAEIPIYNPNYLQVAAITIINSTVVPAKSAPYILKLRFDADKLIPDYYYNMSQMCMAVPNKVIFFLTGHIEAIYLGKKYFMEIDNYFLINCTSHWHAPTLHRV